MASIKDCFKEISTYVSATGFFTKIKVTSSSKATTVEAIEKDKQVILKAQFIDPVDGLDGEFGLSNLSLLGTITSDSEYSLKETVVDVVYETKNNEKIPTELSYVNRSKSSIGCRFLAKQSVPAQPQFNEPVWDVIVKPSKLIINQFNWAANGLAAYEQYFMPKIVNGELKFFIGNETGGDQRAGIVFDSNRSEQFEIDKRWKIALLQNVLKMSDSCDCEMALSTKGAIQITLNTGIAKYRYILPAKVM